jgi:hypothetical protein
MTNKKGDEDVFDLEDELATAGLSPLSEMPSSSIYGSVPCWKLSPTSLLFSFPTCLIVWVTLPLAPAYVVLLFCWALVMLLNKQFGSVSYALWKWSDWLFVYSLISAIEFLVIIHWFPWLSFFREVGK